MDQSLIVYYNPEEYLETMSGNKIHKKTLIKGSDQIQLYGKVIMKKGLIIRGDLAKFTMGKFVILHENVTLKPGYKKAKSGIKFNPMSIGDYVQVESGSIIQANKIGSYVNIGRNCIISERCIIGENSIVDDESIVPPDTVIPPYSVYGGRPAVFLAEMPETASIIMKDKALNYYKNFIAKKNEQSK